MKDWKISAKTKVCGLIGDPVEHSMSPAMHNAAFRELGLDYVYLPFRVTRENLGQAIAGLRGLNFRGLNVTIPHKVEVLQFLDEMDPLAEKIGAVNTIVNNDGVLCGYNTDAGGFLQAMLAKGVEPKGEHIAVLGAGGAARAVTFILADRGAHLTILNRSQELSWAVDLAGHISRVFGRKVDALELNRGNLARMLEKAKILVNA
ncbi:MAG: shikimate dehydrogenase, partial [Chloroflexi bacterium]|nr:shikimate dehydrogenase [Chloroflexota bacterium]